jgi:hypothetical protein
MLDFHNSARALPTVLMVFTLWQRQRGVATKNVEVLAGTEDL